MKGVYAVQDDDERYGGDSLYFFSQELTCQKNGRVHQRSSFDSARISSLSEVLITLLGRAEEGHGRIV